MSKMTDRRVIYNALHYAIEYERSIIEAYRNSLTGVIDESDECVIDARNTIKLYQRVMLRYYGKTQSKTKLDVMLEGAKTVNIYDLMKGRIDDPQTD